MAAATTKRQSLLAPESVTRLSTHVQEVRADMWEITTVDSRTGGLRNREMGHTPARAPTSRRAFGLRAGEGKTNFGLGRARAKVT